MLIRSLHMRSRKKLTCDVIDTIATYVDPVHDVTGTDCWAQNGSTHGHVFAALKRSFLTNRTRNGVK